VLVALAPACGAATDGTSDDDGAEGEGEGEAACVVAAAGAWDVDGPCMGMPMSNTTTVDGCTLTFGDWNMAMSVPAGATIVDDAVTFTGADWTDCTGTIAADGRTIAGECSDGCTMTWTATGG
jgi:hypothetical protein